MSIEAKATLLNAMEHDLASRITAADMSTVLSILSDNLAAFSLDRLKQEENYSQYIKDLILRDIDKTT